MMLKNKAWLGRQCCKETEKKNEKWPKMVEKNWKKKRDETPIL
jgi:hypothetical protein